MTAVRTLVLASLTALLSACGVAEFADASSEAPYRDLVGKQLRSSSELLIHGVTMDRNYAPTLDHYTVTAVPGFSGPEVLSRASLPAGTSMQAISVQRCTNCPFEERIELIVRPVSTQVYSDAPVKISYELVKFGTISVVR